MALEEGMATNDMAPVNENPAPVDEEAAAMEPAEMEHHLSDSFQNNSKIFTEDGFNEEFAADINGVEIDRTAELKQDFKFSKQDLSMILDKFMMGDVRIIQNDDSGSPFERISTVNNYPGEGSRSQGTVENVFAIYGADNSPTAVKVLFRVLALMVSHCQTIVKLVIQSVHKVMISCPRRQVSITYIWELANILIMVWIPFRNRKVSMLTR